MPRFRTPSPSRDVRPARRDLVASLAAAITFLLAAGALAGPLQKTQAEEQEVARVQEFPDLGLTLTLPELKPLLADEIEVDQIRGSWKGGMGPLDVRIALRVFPEDFGFEEPEDVTDLILGNYETGSDDRPPEVRVVETASIPGAYGVIPRAGLLRFDFLDKASGEPIGSCFALGGLLPDRGFSVEIQCTPVADATQAAALFDALRTGVAYTGPTRDPNWSKEELEARWRHDTPDALHKKLGKPVRTAHYIILTDSSGGNLFAKKMEENYAKIQAVYPFEDLEGCRLMPVFLFRTPDEYYDFYVRVAGQSREAAKLSKGHARKDYYATWYESPNDPAHIHEATHQIFMNRLHLTGGGSWFQEGVAEYMSTSRNERNNIARIVKNGEHTPLRLFVKIESLLYSAKGRVKGGSDSQDHYIQAALLIEFLRESAFGKEKFQEFVHAMGSVRGNDVEAIEAVFRSVYGASLDEVDAKFVEYCRKR